MSSLKKHLKKKGFQYIDMKLTKTNHFTLKATINGNRGVFIVDTGASNTCVDASESEYFSLEPEESDTTAAGAGNSEMEAKTAKTDTINIGKFTNKGLNIGVFDLSHINTALIARGAKPVHGIIGADILKKGKAVIDYKKNRLYLK